ncbi:MAG: sulfotransferase [Pseudomonadota bacterium]
MKLSSEFIRLPLAVDAQRLLEEASQFSEYDWEYHPQRYDGNTALNLVSKDGGRSDSYVGQMQATDALQQCPYIQQVMASLGTVIGRSRFMRLAPGKGVPPHSDTDYSWRNRVRIHIPVVTDPNIQFCCWTRQEDGSKHVEKVHMQAGEAWIFDNWREHAVENEVEIERIHLVIDTVGSAEFWKLAGQGWTPGVSNKDWKDNIRTVEYAADKTPELKFEQHNLLPVRSPDEVTNLLADFLADIAHLQQSTPDTYSEVQQAFESFSQDWRAYWALYWDDAAAIPSYQKLTQNLKSFLNTRLADTSLASNGVRAYDVIANWLDQCTDSTAPTRSASTVIGRSEPIAYAGKIPEFEQPVFIVAAPRSGSTMLFEALKNNKDLWTIGDESHQEIESIPSLHPAGREFESNRLLAEDCTNEVRQQVIDAFMYRLQNARSAPYSEMPPEFQPSAIRFLEKTPKNALRIPFFKAMFPQAKFVYLHRRAQPNIGSIIDAWQSGKFVTYADLPGWDEPPWSLLLTPGWAEYKGGDLAQIAAHQWAVTNHVIMDDLSELPAGDSFVVSYEDLLADPHRVLSEVCGFMEVPFGPKMRSFAQTGFPHSRYALTAPASDKWKRHETEIEAVAESLLSIQERIDQFAVEQS